MPISAKRKGWDLSDLLSVRQMDVSYGDVQVVWNSSLNVRQGEIVALFGGNGAGKTTTLRAISGLIPLKGGQILFDGEDISGLEAHHMPELGLTHVPEGRHVFPQMTIQENLEMGAYPKRTRFNTRERLATIYELFPVLKERRSNLAGVLSGGQQQMLAIGRGLMAEPKLIMLDEPSLGLAPAIVTTLFETIAKIKALGVTVLLVEQNLWETIEVADRYYLMAAGKVVSTGVPDMLKQDAEFRQAYLGM